jgi:ABC-2 type transport system permease protein
VGIETKLFLRYKESLFWNFAFPVFFMLLFGLIGFGGGDGVQYIDFLLPGVIAMAIMTTCLISTAIDIVSDRDRGIFRRLFVTPLPKSVFLGGKIVSRYIIVLLQTLLLIVIATVFFGVRIGGNLVLFWLVLTVGMFCFLSLGFLIASFVRRTESVQPISMITFFVMMFLGETFWPMRLMPGFLRVIARVLPSTHLNAALREISIAGAGIGAIRGEILILLCWLVVCFALSSRLFRWE